MEVGIIHPIVQPTEATTIHSINNTRADNVKTEGTTATSTTTTTSSIVSVSTRHSNIRKANEIFNKRASIRSCKRTADKIKTFVTITLAFIGIGTIIAGCILGAAGIPLIAAVGIVIGGHVIGFMGALHIPLKHILTDEEEREFWNSLSKDSLGQLYGKRLDLHSRGSTYGRLEGVCDISYPVLRNNELMNDDSVEKLEKFFEEYRVLMVKESNEMSPIISVSRNNSNILQPNEINKITERYAVLKSNLKAEFETFRTAFIDNRYLHNWVYRP
jgi:hypothetical protein